MKRTKQTKKGNVTDVRGKKKPILRGVGKPKREWVGGVSGLRNTRAFT